MVLMVSRNFSSPSASIFCGVSATSNNARVALLTPASVACADSTTATRSVKGLRCSSSPFGSGLAFRKRSKTSKISAAVQGLDRADFFEGRCEGLFEGLAGTLTFFLAARVRPDLGVAFFTDWPDLRDFLTGFASKGFDLAGCLRMIFAMMRVY